MQLLNKLVEKEGEEADVKRLDNVDWEDVFLLQDDNEWPSNPPEFRYFIHEAPMLLVPFPVPHKRMNNIRKSIIITAE